MDIANLYISKERGKWYSIYNNDGLLGSVLYPQFPDLL